MANEETTLLPELFERSLSLDRQGTKNNRAMSLFERMAARLDEIAANTRGLVGGIIAYASGEKRKTKTQAHIGEDNRESHVARKADGNRTHSISREINIASHAQEANNLPTTQQSEIQTAENKIVVATPVNEQSRKLTNIAGEHKNVGAEKSRQAREQKRNVPTESALANEKAREKQNQEENDKRITDAVLAGMNKLGSLTHSGLNAVAQNSDAKDAAGYAVGGPFYGALKEIKEAMPDFDREKLAERKERKEESKKTINVLRNKNGKQRDDKGRFIKADQNAARREIAQTEAIEAQLAFDEKEAKAEDKRHKELVRAVKANKRGMLDRFLDRRMGLGRPGRDRVIRERVVRDKVKPGRGTAHASGPRHDGSLLGDRGQRNRHERTPGGARPEQRRGLLSRAGGVARGAGKAVTGTLAMSGKAMGGLLRALPGIGQALALGMAAYEGFQGWNDKELHKQAFGLKDGQEATTGQKASAAAASILDMGGLTSGLLGMLGIEFDKAGVAKSIYEFGSNIATVARGFIEQAGPLLSQVWGGIEDLSGKVWAGAKEIGSSVAGFATNIWDKGAAFAGQIGDWAQNAINEGVGVVTGIWDNAKSAVAGCWANLEGFAADSIAKGGAILSNLWKGITELPGKIVDGAKNLALNAKDVAVNAYEGGKNLLSRGLKAFTGLFSDDEAEAATQPETILPKHEPKSQKTVIQEPVAQTSATTHEISPESGKLLPPAITQPEFQPNAAKVDINPDSEGITGIAQSPPSAQPESDSKLLNVNLDEDAKKTFTSSEGASGTMAIHQMNQANKDSHAQQELIDNLEELNRSTKNISKLLENEFRDDILSDEFGIAGALQGVSSAITNIRTGGGGSYYGSSGGSGGGGGRAAFAYNPDSKIGDTIAHEESGKEGVHKIGYDGTGGTSYGKWQLSSKTGSYKEWLELLESKGGKHAEIASQLRAAGPANTGSRTGHHVDVYKQLAAENAQLFEDTQRESLLKHNYNPAMKNLRSESLRKMIENDKSLQEMMFSTSVQHGGGGAASIFNKVYKEGMGREDLIHAVYGERGGHFGSSTAQVQSSVNNRFRREQELILGMNQGEANIRTMRDRIANGGTDAVSAGSSAMVAAATQKAIDNHVGYNMGSKNSAAGEIDCSGWVAEINRHMMADLNAAMGEEVFNKEARRTLSKGAEGGAAGIIQAVGQKTGKIYSNAELAPENVREGMAIGLSLGSHAKGRFRDIGHIVQTYRDPETGEMMVSESVSNSRGTGARGVVKTRYSDWYKKYGNAQMHGVDMMAMADASKVKPVHPAAQADTAQAQVSPESAAQTDQPQMPPQAVEATLAATPNKALEEARTKAEAAKRKFNQEISEMGYTEKEILNVSATTRNGKDFDPQIANAQELYADMQKAQDELAKLEAEQAQATPGQPETTAQALQPTPTPQSMAVNAAHAAIMAIPDRMPEKPESVREIDPEREIKTSSNDNGALVAILNQILQAIENGNQKLAAFASSASKNADGPPSIRTEYDDPSAQSLAADTA